MLVAALPWLLAGCAFRSGTEGNATLEARLRHGPLSWQAEMSCPGCAERWMTVTLFADGTFRVRERYPRAGSTPEDFHDLGRWTLSPDRPGQLVLDGAVDPPRQFQLQADGRLRLQTADGRDIRSIRDYVLVPLAKPDPIAEPMRLLGMYAGGRSPVFTECQTGVAWPVLTGEIASELQRRQPALMGTGPVLLSLRGRLNGRPDAPQQPGELMVEQVDRFWPGETCSRGPLAPAQPLEETGWQLVELEGQVLPAMEVSRQPRLRLRQGRLQGFAGCNRVSGSYSRQGEQVQVSRLITTRMACPAPDLAREQAVLALLRSVRQWRLSGSQLEWRDGDKVRARWIAGDML